MLNKDNEKIKSSDALNKLKNNQNNKRVKKKKTPVSRIINFFKDFNNYNIIIFSLVIGLVLIFLGIKLHIGKIEDNNMVLFGTIIRSLLIAIGSGVIVSGIFQQRRKW